MEFENIKELIELKYDIKVTTIEKIKNTYRINGSEGYCLKIVKYDFPHFYFIYKAIDHLISVGAENIIKFIKTKDGDDFIEINESYGYLTRWIKSRCADYSNLDEVLEISKEIAKLHKSSEGFIITPEMRPRVNWLAWENVFNTRRDEILDFRKRINQKAYLNDFDKKYLENVEREIWIANESILNLKESKYKEIMSKHIMKLGFCHHDLANHNILIDTTGNIKFIDFDYCYLDSYIHDLASFIVRVLRGNNWQKNVAEGIISSYSTVTPISEDEITLIKAFIRFPQGFWQLGLQAYWERQPWSEEKYNLRLDKYLKESKSKEQFILDFFK